MIFLIFTGLGYTKVSKIRLSRTWISRWVQKNIIVLLVYNSQYHQHNSQRGFDYDWKWLQDGDKVSIRYDIFVKICNGSTWHLRKQFISEIETRFKCHSGWNSAYKRQLVVKSPAILAGIKTVQQWSRSPSWWVCSPHLSVLNISDIF